MLHIVIACGAMPFGPTTPLHRSLGGSETAALMLGRALSERGHHVVMFCNLPQQGPDAWQAGQKDDVGVSYQPIEGLQQYATTIPHDLFIGVRDPAFMVFPAQCKKKVLWMHDVATKRGMQRAFDQMAWAMDEVWTVSEWHRQQVNEVTGYPLQFIVPLRNGIVRVETAFPERSDKVLLYAARPERGLDNLIKPGGVMEHLPEYTLKVAMYEHFPEHMRDYYQGVFARMAELPNVEFIGGKSQPELRQIMAECAAYIYPTQFKETSCIIARECIEQGTPFLTTMEGALPETLGDCGIFFETTNRQPFELDIPKGSPEWCETFARFVKYALSNGPLLAKTREEMSKRKDLYWDGVAELVEQNAAPKDVTIYSRLWSLMQDGDVMPARALIQKHITPDNFQNLSVQITNIDKEILENYRFVQDNMSDFYEDMYVEKGKTPETELVFSLDFNKTNRWQSISVEISKLKPGSIVLEYGCGPGHVLAPLAKQFPAINFVGYDVSKSAVAVVNQGAEENKLENLNAVSETDTLIDQSFDAVICTEVLEHCMEPWIHIFYVEGLVKPGGRVIVTVPFGAWEPKSYERKGHWYERQHLWAIDQQMFKDMLGDKPGHQFLHMPDGLDNFARPIGHMLMVYDADHKHTNAIDPLAKALRHNSRQTTAACVIAYNNEDTILRLLNSLDKRVQFVQFAHGPSTDKTAELIADWFKDHPWMGYRIIDVPKIEAWKFGFDDARNKSLEGLQDDFDWFLWIDTDEYLAGDFSRYLRNSALDGYLVAQHHFTVEPRGRPAEIDRPARLLRSGRGFQARGHIHEHFEIPAGGPGMCIMLNDVDIGHTGYVNEKVRRDRFYRNYPFLQWDHETQADRPLHAFLWFRDIVHNMRFQSLEGQPGVVQQLAKEGVRYYNEHAEEMGAFGPGLYMSLTYLSECYQTLNMGVPLKLDVTLEDRGAVLEGRFESFDQVVRTLRQILEPEFKDRTGEYW